MTEKWDLILYLEAGASIRYTDKTLSEIFALIGGWGAHRSNSPIVSFRARRSLQEPLT